MGMGFTQQYFGSAPEEVEGMLALIEYIALAEIVEKYQAAGNRNKHRTAPANTAPDRVAPHSAEPGCTTATHHTMLRPNALLQNCSAPNRKRSKQSKNFLEQKFPLVRIPTEKKDSVNRKFKWVSKQA